MDRSSSALNLIEESKAFGRILFVTRIAHWRVRKLCEKGRFAPFIVSMETLCAGHRQVVRAGVVLCGPISDISFRQNVPMDSTASNLAREKSKGVELSVRCLRRSRGTRPRQRDDCMGRDFYLSLRCLQCSWFLSMIV